MVYILYERSFPNNKGQGRDTDEELEDCNHQMGLFEAYSDEDREPDPAHVKQEGEFSKNA